MTSLPGWRENYIV